MEVDAHYSVIDERERKNGKRGYIACRYNSIFTLTKNSNIDIRENYQKNSYRTP